MMSVLNPVGTRFKVAIWPEPWGEGAANAIMSRARNMAANHPACLAGEPIRFKYDGYRVFLEPILETERCAVDHQN